MFEKKKKQSIIYLDMSKNGNITLNYDMKNRLTEPKRIVNDLIV